MKALLLKITLVLLLFTTTAGFAAENSVDLPKLSTGADKKIRSTDLKLSIVLPSSMVTTNELDYGVPFQYADFTEELYIIANLEASDEAKAALIEMEIYDENSSLSENYLDFTVGLMEDNGTVISNQSEITDISAKNAKGKMLSVDGDVEGIDVSISYWLATFEHNGNVYKFIFWARQSEKKSAEKIALKAFKSITFE